MAARSGTGQQEMMGRPSYEDIKPKSAEWKEDKTAHVLNVRLPGFVKEQIKVTYDENLRSFNVEGERPLGNNRFGRLNVDFTLPDNCTIKEMQGKFQDEVVTITIPKGHISPPFLPEETTTTARSPPEKGPGISQKPPLISEPPRVPPQIPPPVYASPTPSSSGQQEMMGPPSYEDIKPKSAEWKVEKGAHVLNVPLPGFAKEQIKVTYDENSRSFNVQGESPLGNNRFGRLNVDFTVPDNCKIKEMQGNFQDEVLTITIPKGPSPLFVPRKTATSVRSDFERWKSAKTRERNEIDPKAAERPGEKVPDRGKELLEKEMKRASDTDVAGFAGKETTRPEKSDSVKSKAGETESLVDDAKKKKRDGKVGEAEKQLIVNVGVAALVLVALGAYVGFNFAGPRSAKD